MGVRRLWHWGPAFALWLIATLSAAAVLIVLKTWPASLQRALHLFMFSSEVALLLASYISAVLLGPGSHCPHCLVNKIKNIGALTTLTQGQRHQAGRR